MSNVFSYIFCFGWLPYFLAMLLGALIWWLLSLLFGKSHEGDLTLEGEGQLRAEADGLRARVRELEARLHTVDGDITLRDNEIADLRAQLTTAGTNTALAANTDTEQDDDDTYALEWRNRYLAARVKYLESRLAETPKAETPKAEAAPTPKKKTSTKPKAKAAPKKTAAKTAAKPPVLYTDGPTDGDPDDLKLIKGIGPKFEKDLHGKGIYYFRQIGNWKKKDVTMVEGVIDSIPGRIERDEWVKQAKALTKSQTAAAKKPAAKASAASPSKTKKSSVDYDKYYANVKKFDSKAKRETVDNIVKYCGVALRSRDSSLVACSDPSELQTVSKNFCVKKLGLDKEQSDALVKTVCEDMKSQRFKNRVTFYYLCAKRAGKLDVFS